MAWLWPSRGSWSLVGSACCNCVGLDTIQKQKHGERKLLSGKLRSRTVEVSRAFRAVIALELNLFTQHSRAVY